jgi:uncharacterized DUF497 family protein
MPRNFCYWGTSGLVLRIAEWRAAREFTRAKSSLEESPFGRSDAKTDRLCQPATFSSHLTKLLAARSILDLDFEWDDTKAADNVRNHGVSFAQAALAFRDPFAVEWIDLREAYGEERIILLGMTGNQVLSVVYTERAERIRIISARRATKNEQDHYYRQIAP